MLKINCKGKRTVGKAHKGINVEKNNRFKKLRIKMKNSKQKRKRKGSGEIIEKRKRKTPQNSKSPM